MTATTQQLNAMHNFGYQEYPGYKKGRAMADEWSKGSKQQQMYVIVANLKATIYNNERTLETYRKLFNAPATTQEVKDKMTAEAPRLKQEIAEAKGKLAEIEAKEQEEKKILEDTQFERNISEAML